MGAWSGVEATGPPRGARDRDRGAIGESRCLGRAMESTRSGELSAQRTPSLLRVAGGGRLTLVAPYECPTFTCVLYRVAVHQSASADRLCRPPSGALDGRARLTGSVNRLYSGYENSGVGPGRRLRRGGETGTAHQALPKRGV